MKRSLFFLFILPLIAFGAPKENVALQELRLDLEEYSRSLHANKVDIELLHEKIENLQNLFATLKDELKSTGEVDLEVTKERASHLEKKVAQMEKNTLTFASDLQLLKNHINETASSFSQWEKKVETLEKELSSDIRSLKSTLQTIASYIEGGKSDGKNYMVQSGDTLEKIAQKYKTSIKELKEANNLSSDRIYSGQKLNIP